MIIGAFQIKPLLNEVQKHKRMNHRPSGQAEQL